MHLRDLATAIESLAPPSYAEQWDNVGLLIGDDSRPVRGPVMLTIDLTEPVIEEAARRGCDAVIAYHPPVFEPLKRITAESGRQRVVLRAIEAGLAVYSPHTALDAAPAGMTDWLADGVLPAGSASSADRRALAPHQDLPPTEQVKIVTFVPLVDVERVRSALASSGAGRIGEYELCSFAVQGRGTFRGGEGTDPAVGEAGNFEQVEELRLEMVCSRRALPLAVRALREFHPYEEPPIDIYPLLARPIRCTGAGRRLLLDQPATVREIASRIKDHLGISAVKVAALTDQPVRCVGVCPGAGAQLAPAALADGCHVYITGEMRYHEVLHTLEEGMSIILAGHTNTERGYLPVFAGRLRERLAGIDFVISDVDRTPFEIV